MEKTIGAYEARRKFGQLLEEAFYNHDNFVVERSGRAMAAIVPIDTYQKWQRLAKERVFLILEEAWERTRGTPAHEFEADLEAALETLRQESLDDRQSS
jgi:prevent-host-death family protein